jgi:hypothetical protein
VYGVTQMRDAHTSDHGRIPEDHRRVAGLVEQRDPGSEQQRDEVDVYLVQKPGVEALPDGVAAVNAHRAFSGGSGRLGHGAFEPVGDEVDGRESGRARMALTSGYSAKGRCYIQTRH